MFYGVTLFNHRWEIGFNMDTFKVKNLQAFYVLGRVKHWWKRIWVYLTALRGVPGVYDRINMYM